MIEKECLYNVTVSKIIERIVSDDNVDINHMVLQKGDELPIHDSNSNVYLIIVRGEANNKCLEKLVKLPG